MVNKSCLRYRDLASSRLKIPGGWIATCLRKGSVIMFLRVVQLSATLMVGVLLACGPAKAITTTMTPGVGTHLLSVGSVYKYTTVDFPDGLTPGSSGTDVF